MHTFYETFDDEFYSLCEDIGDVDFFEKTASNDDDRLNKEDITSIILNNEKLYMTYGITRKMSI